jgi:precorrin-8X/cobalt-precorrin-8 methylmutase
MLLLSCLEWRTINSGKNVKDMNKTGLIIIGHGSKLPHNRETIEKLADILRKRGKFDIVEIAFMTRNKPGIPNVIEKVARQGTVKVVLIPTFLAHGVHTKQEIPEILKLKQEESALKARGVELVYGEPLGSDERIAEIIEEKALKAIGQDSRSETTQTGDASTLTASTSMFKTSIEIIRGLIGDVLEKAPKTHAPIIERVVHTTADPEFAKLVVIHEKAVEAGVAAIKAGAKIMTDVKMVRAGINAKRVGRFGGQIFTYLTDERTLKLAKQESITRSAAAMRLAVRDGVDNAIIVIGNAPTAAFELAEAVEEGRAKPALIIATPVGYVGAAESKEAVAKLPIPYVIIKGSKGGSALAVAVFNALLVMAENETAVTDA